MLIVINDIPPSNNKFIGRNMIFQYQEEKKKWHWLVKAAIKDKPQSAIIKARITLTYYFKSKTRRDPDNFSGKMLLDPLVREGIIVDDCFDYIELVLKCQYDKVNPRTEILIEEVLK